MVLKVKGTYYSDEGDALRNGWVPVPESAISYGLYSEMTDGRFREIDRLHSAACKADYAIQEQQGLWREPESTGPIDVEALFATPLDVAALKAKPPLPTPNTDALRAALGAEWHVFRAVQSFRECLAESEVR